ncbi:sugar transferase [Chitinispirillales bacterium ANBcel5]|uniref:sugar transferase n=1 Tax=Cellulosispirillum alkaliphilum TaxID=3039283 RepID=UPI002A576DF1|nr:sugar transferase [Chitinispirillales bacterium ANBcel5]
MILRLLEKIFTFLFDWLAINVALFTTFWIRYSSGLFSVESQDAINPYSYIEPSFILSGAWLVLFFLTGLYRDWYKESRVDEFFVVARTIFMGMFFLFLITSAPQIMEFARTGDINAFLTPTKFATLFTYGGCMLFFASINRFAMHTFIAFLHSKGIAVNKILIIGANDSGKKLLKDINSFPKLGYRVVGFVDDDGKKCGSSYEGLPVLGTYSKIPQIIKKEGIDGIIISHVSASPNEISKILDYCGDINVTIYMVPSLMDVITGHLKTHQLFGVPLMVLLQDHMPGWEAQIKRLIDMLISLSVLVIGAPLWSLLAIIIRLTSPGSPIYSQTRVGQNGKNYTMYKFRSMYIDAEKRSGPQWASENDPRITPVGRFIRKTRLDEIPQFFNVLKGEMSLVGPRPERPVFVEQLKREIPWYIRRIKMKPGITGWAQVKHKYDASIEDVKEKVIHDLYYFENMSLSLDIKILLRTILVVLTGKGAH